MSFAYSKHRTTVHASERGQSEREPHREAGVTLDVRLRASPVFDNLRRRVSPRARGSRDGAGRTLARGAIVQVCVSWRFNMSMTELLAMYLARRATPAPAKPVAKPAKPAPAKPVAAAAKPVAAKPVAAKPAPVAPPAPLTAERAVEFLRAVTTGSTEEKKVALEAFVGFKPGEPLGAQIDRASALARSTINRAKGTPAPVTERSNLPTVGGWVAGIPDMTARRVGDLKARERLALALRLDLEKVENLEQLRSLIRGTDYSVSARLTDAEAREAARRFAWHEEEKRRGFREALRQMGY